MHGAYVRRSVLVRTLTIGRIAYRREGGDSSTQRCRSVIYDCLVAYADCVPRMSRLSRVMARVRPWHQCVGITVGHCVPAPPLVREGEPDRQTFHALLRLNTVIPVYSLTV